MKFSRADRHGAFPAHYWRARGVDVQELDEALSEFELYCTERKLQLGSGLWWQTMPAGSVPFDIDQAAVDRAIADTENIHDQPGACATVIRRQIEADAASRRPPELPLADRSDPLIDVAMMLTQREEDRIRLLGDEGARHFMAWAAKYLAAWEQQDLRHFVTAALQHPTKIDLSFAYGFALDAATARQMRDREESEREKLDGPARKAAARLAHEAATVREALASELAA